MGTTNQDVVNAATELGQLVDQLGEKSAAKREADTVVASAMNAQSTAISDESAARQAVRSKVDEVIRLAVASADEDETT